MKTSRNKFFAGGWLWLAAMRALWIRVDVGIWNMGLREEIHAIA
jgi:hypothetical protein